MTKILGILIGLLLALAIIVGMSAFFALLVWLGWKYVAVAAFSAPALSFLQVWVGLTAINIVLASLRAVFKSN